MNTPALASPIGMRPLGSDMDSARVVGDHRWAIELGGQLPNFDALSDTATKEDREVYDQWYQLPAWPAVRGQYGWGDNNEVVFNLGPQTTAAWRKFFIRAEAPWKGEYLQALMQFGGGFQVVGRKPMGYVRFPAIYERGDWTFHVAGGGYYLFNDQPIIDGLLGLEYRPFSFLHLGANAHLRMDAKKVTPMDGSWSFGGGVRIQPFNWGCVQLEAIKESGPPTGEGITSPRPQIELTGMVLRASATYYY